jgi:flagellar biosynthesis protein FliP
MSSDFCLTHLQQAFNVSQHMFLPYFVILRDIKYN